MFTDLPEDHMFYSDIMRLANLGLVAGYEDGTVHPDAAVPFGRLCALLNRLRFRDLVEKDVLETVMQSVVMIVTQLPDGKAATGAGFFINPTTIVTNQHVINGGVLFQAYIQGVPMAIKLKALTDISDMHDLAMMESPVENPFLKLRSNPIYQGQHIGVIGHPLAEYVNSFSQGVISNTRREDDRGYMTLFQTDAAINPGNSGGPIIDGRGEVCGVVVSKVMGTGIEGLAFGIQVEHLRKFCEVMGVMLGA